MKPLEGLDLPASGIKGGNVSAAEMKMAQQLVEDMSGKWDPDDFKDEFKHAVMKIVDKKVKAGDTETVIEPEEEAPSQGAEVIDLTELLTRSLKGGEGARASVKSASVRSDASSMRPTRKAASKKSGTTAKRKAA